MRDLDQVAQPGHAEPARTPHGIAPAELRGRVYWATPHSTPQCWVNRFSLCYARVHSRPMRDLGQMAQPDHCGPTRHVQRARTVEVRSPMHWAASPSTVGHSSEFGMLFTGARWRSFATRS